MLSIIIPYYNTLKEIKELMSVLEPQLNDNVEVIIVDDGCNEKEKERYKKRIKPIRCIETNIIYQGQKDLKNNGFNPSNVFMVCNSIRKTASGFYWEYV